MNKINEINSQKQESHRSNIMLPFAIAIMTVLNSSPSDAQMTLDPGPVKPWPKAMLDAYCR